MVSARNTFFFIANTSIRVFIRILYIRLIDNHHSYEKISSGELSRFDYTETVLEHNLNSVLMLKAVLIVH